MQQQILCKDHKSPVYSICTSPACDYFKLMCEDCRKADEGHSASHLEWRQAREQALRVGSRGLTSLQGLKVRKNQQMEQNINNSPGLAQLQSKIEEIGQIITKKLQGFKNNIRKAYDKHVRQRLDELDQMIQKSEQFLKRQMEKLAQNNYSSLYLFFKNDLDHQVKYFQSYFNEIFAKKIRSFKTAIENDRIFSLLTNFEQSLHKLFTISKEGPVIEQIRQSHLFANEDGQCYFYTFSQNLKQLISQPIAAMNRISYSQYNLHELGGNYMWKGNPQSIYYPQGNCYYIIGQGDRSSNLIVKYQYRKGVNQAFRVAKTMETERRNFGVCLLNGEIYIIGGENEKEGCLVKCQKFVPGNNNQVYIIHSLRSRSSRHSITTYKDKFILKFGGVKKIIDSHSECLLAQNAAPPQIYSLKTEEWIAIPFNHKISFYLEPAIFKAEHRNFILVLGGDKFSQSQQTYRPAYQVTLDQSMGKIDHIKIRQRMTKIEYRDHIYNSTVALLDEDNQCIFIKRRVGEPQIGRYKIEF